MELIITLALAIVLWALFTAIELPLLRLTLKALFKACRFG